MKTILNPDKETVTEIKKKLVDNNGFCPCSLIKNKDTKCVCKDFREMIKNKELGECHCGLYQNIE